MRDLFLIFLFCFWFSFFSFSLIWASSQIQQLHWLLSIPPPQLNPPYSRSHSLVIVLSPPLVSPQPSINSITHTGESVFALLDAWYKLIYSSFYTLPKASFPCSMSLPHVPSWCARSGSFSWFRILYKLGIGLEGPSSTPPLALMLPSISKLWVAVVHSKSLLYGSSDHCRRPFPPKGESVSIAPSPHHRHPYFYFIRDPTLSRRPSLQWRKIPNK